MNHHLKVFVEVAKWKSFTRAAEALHMSQPAVSQYIASLEQEFGVKLLERSNKFVRLNKAGKIVNQHAKEILRNYDLMKVLVSDLKNNPSGELHIGASYTIGEYVLPPILAILQSKYPLISPNVTIGNTEVIGKKLLEQQIDIGLIEGCFSHRLIVEKNFAEDEMYIIASTGRSLIKNKKVLEKGIKSAKLELGNPEQSMSLDELTWIIREIGSGTRIISEDFLKRKNIFPKKILTLGSTQIIKEAVESGIGISLLSKWAIKKELQLGTVYKMDVLGTPVARDFSIIKMKQAFYPKALQVFEKIIIDSV